MPSDPLPPIGFWSYSREDDRRARGRLSQLRALLTEELEGLFGRHGGVRLFQDVSVIAYGDLWENEITEALNACTFLVPILTPDFFQSPWCCKEVRHFQEREQRLGRGSLIFPIRYLDTRRIDPANAKQVQDRAVWDRMLATQHVNYEPLRHFPPESTVAVQQLVAELAGKIAEALHREPGSAPVAEVPAPRPSPVIVAPPPPPPPPPVPAKPAWASAAGTDRFGDWADLSVTGKDGRQVVQRLRLIKPGRFMMGSPDSEAGRWDREGPQHEVTIRQPFWLFDTPCTQALWEAVMGSSPSHFKGLNRPVERVSFNDTGEFLRRLGLTLPSEAQWEYACRAGSSGPRYAEPLDDIAWYDGNSGGETHPVGQKRANDWGLHDMLGNVWEWCADAWQDNYRDAPADGSARPGDGAAARVLRGGAWAYEARSVRAASRNVHDPSDRDASFGFRCARVQEPV